MHPLTTILQFLLFAGLGALAVGLGLALASAVVYGVVTAGLLLVCGICAAIRKLREAIHK